MAGICSTGATGTYHDITGQASGHTFDIRDCKDAEPDTVAVTGIKELSTNGIGQKFYVMGGERVVLRILSASDFDQGSNDNSGVIASYLASRLAEIDSLFDGRRYSDNATVYHNDPVCGERGVSSSVGDNDYRRQYVSYVRVCDSQRVSGKTHEVVVNNTVATVPEQEGSDGRIGVYYGATTGTLANGNKWPGPNGGYNNILASTLTPSDPNSGRILRHDGRAFALTGTGGYVAGTKYNPLFELYPRGLISTDRATSLVSGMVTSLVKARPVDISRSEWAWDGVVPRSAADLIAYRKGKGYNPDPAFALRSEMTFVVCVLRAGTAIDAAAFATCRGHAEYDQAQVADASDDGSGPQLRLRYLGLGRDGVDNGARPYHLLLPGVSLVDP